MGRSVQLESHIVVVDTRPGDYHDLTCWAGQQQWHVHLLTTSEAAIKFKAREYADLWLVNASLPEMTGFALCKILDMQSRGIPVFIVSDRYEPEHERLACQCGAGYLAKSAGQALNCRWHLELLQGNRCNGELARCASPSGQPLTRERSRGP